MKVFKQTLIYIGTFLLLIAFICPLLMLPFVHKLPYLHTLTLWQRLPISLIIFIFSYLMVIGGAKPKNREGAISMLKGARNFVFTLIGFGLFIFSGAWLSANSLGSLVKLLPNEPYASQVQLTLAEERGSKYKSIDLELRSNSNGQIYYLTLSRRLFDYPEFSKGDHLTLKGKQNWFGAYVEGFEVINKQNQ